MTDDHKHYVYIVWWCLQNYTFKKRKHVIRDGAITQICKAKTRIFHSPNIWSMQKPIAIASFVFIPPNILYILGMYIGRYFRIGNVLQSGVLYGFLTSLHSNYDYTWGVCSCVCVLWLCGCFVSNVLYLTEIAGANSTSKITYSNVSFLRPRPKVKRCFPCFHIYTYIARNIKWWMVLRLCGSS